MTAMYIYFACPASILPSSGNSTRFSWVTTLPHSQARESKWHWIGLPHTYSLIPQSASESPTQNHHEWFIDQSMTQTRPITMVLGLMAQKNIKHSSSTWVTKLVEYNLQFASSHLCHYIGSTWPEMNQTQTTENQEIKIWQIYENICRTPRSSKTQNQFYHCNFSVLRANKFHFLLKPDFVGFLPLTTKSPNTMI